MLWLLQLFVALFILNGCGIENASSKREATSENSMAADAKKDQSSSTGDQIVTPSPSDASVAPGPSAIPAETAIPSAEESPSPLPSPSSSPTPTPKVTNTPVEPDLPPRCDLRELACQNQYEFIAKSKKCLANCNGEYGTFRYGVAGFLELKADLSNWFSVYTEYTPAVNNGRVFVIASGYFGYYSPETLEFKKIRKMQEPSMNFKMASFPLADGVYTAEFVVNADGMAYDKCVLNKFDATSQTSAVVATYTNPFPKFCNNQVMAVTPQAPNQIVSLSRDIFLKSIRAISVNDMNAAGTLARTVTLVPEIVSTVNSVFDMQLVTAKNGDLLLVLGMASTVQSIFKIDVNTGVTSQLR